MFDHWVPKTPAILTKQVLVCPLLLKPGKVLYQFIEKSTGRVFRSHERHKGEFTAAHFARTLFSEMRTEPIPFVISNKARCNNLRPFDKLSSVFSEQRDDEPSTLKMMQENDFKNWTVQRVVKSESDVSPLALTCAAQSHQDLNKQAYAPADHRIPRARLLRAHLPQDWVPRVP